MKARLISLDYHVPQRNTNLYAFPAIIGRGEEVDIRLDDHSVADRHCRIDWDGENWIVNDLETVHGTSVNGSRIGESVLRPGDELSVGMLTFLVEAVRENDAHDVSEREMEGCALGAPSSARCLCRRQPRFHDSEIV